MDEVEKEMVERCIQRAEASLNDLRLMLFGNECHHKRRVETTTMGSQRRAFYCPECKVKWEQEFERPGGV